MNTVILDNLYRNGEPVKMMIRNGEVIYQGVTKTEPEPPVPTAKPLTLNITGPGDIKFHKSNAAAPDANINVYKNGEFVANWQTSGTEVNSISVVAGDEVSFICGYNDGMLHALANNRQGPPSPEGSRYNGFSGSTATCTVDGKLLSILSSDWEDKESFAEYGQEEILHVCADLFRLFTGLTSAENLIVPTDTMAYCYLHLFSGSGIQKSPVLRAAEPTNDSYSYMFSGCTEINYITCLLNNGNNTRYIVDGWLTTGKVPSTGTFVKKAGVVWEYGIPTGWTIIDAPE